MRNGAEATVAAHDIARLANVGRAAVSNWRRRFPDFPEPVGGSSASPLYALAEVEEWLTRHGKQFQLMPGDRVWQRVRGAVDDLRLGDLIGYLGAFLVFLQRDSRRWKTLARRSDEVIADELTGAIASTVPELPAGLTERLDAEWVGIVRLIADAADHQEHAELFDFLCDRYLQVHSRRHATVTPTHLAELMVRLADVSEGVVLDPACGIGTLLLAAHAGGAVALHGQEIDGTSARLAAARLLLHDSAINVSTGDSLRQDAFAELRADAVVCNPPFNERSWGYDELTSDPRWEYGLPPRGEPELAWVQHCLAHLKPGGRLVIMMPTSAASRRAGRRIRGNLLRSGALRAVISLSGAGPAATLAPDLWVLSRPDADQPPPSQVLMVDASNDSSFAEEAWQAFLADPDKPTFPLSRSMRIIDLLDDEVDVSPVRHLTSSVASADGGNYTPARTKFFTTNATLANTLPDLAASVERESLPMTTFGELIKAGVIVIHQAPLKMTTDCGETPVLTAKDLRIGRPPSGRTTIGPGAVIVEAGDVVAPMSSRDPVARVLTAGGAVLGPQLYLFRADPERVDPHFLAGFLRIAQSQSASRSSSLLVRTDARRASIPRLPLAEQRAYGEAFRRLTAFEDALRETAALGETLVRLGFAGLADGSLQSRPGTD
ncbi:SAM-dependent methyltransferase [Micromonospora aurantiaca]|uniref:SAM-dependent methyltransferase n=2 Tax=Micromonospora aurantiaca (nom. illeg.) TaxID=47850 RepID=A0A6N3KAH7_9ACTN|nr:SAM-dependent methyltransferase [Micromonospora aurantiaca]